MAEENKNPHSGHRDRLKARFVNEGLDSFEEHQILELLLFYSVPLKDTNEIAHSLLKTFGSISRVLDACPEELMKVNGVSKHSSTLINLIPQLARIYYRDLARERPILDSTDKAGNYIKTFFMGRIYEVFYLFCLDNSCRIIHEEKICEGTLDETPCYPRLVLESAFRHNAKKVILAHNHPSGILRPSQTDIDYTCKLVSLFENVDIEIVDHIIVGKSDFISMKEIGVLKNY